MADDERQDEQAEEPTAEEPAAEEPAAEEPAAEEPAAEEPAAEEPTAEEHAAEEPAAEEPAAEEPAAEAEETEAPEAEEKATSTEEQGRGTEQPSEPSTEPPKAKDLPPGAELEPIKLEPERELSAEERARVEAEAEERARREAEATAETGPDEVSQREPTVKLASDQTIQATGKRKSSIARVVVRAGAGGFTVNDRNLDEYFPRDHLRALARQPLAASGYERTVDVRVRVHGGGISGQAGAVRHGIARALCEIDPELRGELKRRGLLTRDARRKERRKAGLKKARKRPQFSKR